MPNIKVFCKILPLFSPWGPDQGYGRSQQRAATDSGCGLVSLVGSLSLRNPGKQSRQGKSRVPLLGPEDPWSEPGGLISAEPGGGGGAGAVFHAVWATGHKPAALCPSVRGGLITAQKLTHYDGGKYDQSFLCPVSSTRGLFWILTQKNHFISAGCHAAFGHKGAMVTAAWEEARDWEKPTPMASRPHCVPGTVLSPLAAAVLLIFTTL